jgi:hypothetical protein
MPDWVADKRARLARIGQAKAELEAEAKAKERCGTPKRITEGTIQFKGNVLAQTASVGLVQSLAERVELIPADPSVDIGDLL